MLTLTISDVPFDDLSIIASGPTVADPSTFEDALKILSKHNISDHVNVVGPPQNHNGYVVYQDGKIIGPRYRYYETASENAGCGSVTSFDLAVRENWI